MPGRPTVCGVGGIGSQVRSRLISRSALPTNLRQASLSLFEPPKHLRQLLLLGAPLVRAGQERIIFSTEMVPLPQYLKEMSLSDFCLVPMGSTSWTLGLYDALFLGCVPVILSDHIALPFEERIDWSKLAIKWPQADAERLPSFLLGLSQEQIRVKRRAILAARHNFAWSCNEGGAFAQLVASLVVRKQALTALLGQFLTEFPEVHYDDPTTVGREDDHEGMREGGDLLSLDEGIEQYVAVADPPPVATFWVDKPGDVQMLLNTTNGCARAMQKKKEAPEHSLMGSAQYDVVAVFRELNCVLRAALRSLEERLTPPKVHLILDSCDGIEKIRSEFPAVRCVELASALPSIPAEAMAAIPPERKSWCIAAASGSARASRTCQAGQRCPQVSTAAGQAGRGDLSRGDGDIPHVGRRHHRGRRRDARADVG